MPLKFHCSNGHGLTVSEQDAGKSVRCPKCKEQLHAPAPAPSEVAKAFTLVKSEKAGVNLAEFSVAAESSVARETRAAQQSGRRRRSREHVPEESGGRSPLGFILVLLLVAAIVAVIWFASRGAFPFTGSS